MNPHTYGHLILSSGKNKAFSIHDAGSTGSQHVEECKWILSYRLVQSSSPSGSRTSTKTQSTKTNRRESGEEFRTHRHRGNFPEQNTNGSCSKIQNQKKKWDLIKLQSFYNAKDTVNRTKQHQQIIERIFINTPSDRGLISKIYTKKLKKLDSRESNNPI